MRGVWCCSGLSAVLLLSVLPAAAEDWPLPFHDSANTAMSGETIRVPLKLAWTLDLSHLDGHHVRQVVVSAGRAYVADQKRLLALELRTGNKVWEAPGNWSAVCVDEGKVIAAGYAWPPVSPPEVAAFDPFTGRELWHTQVSGNSYGVFGGFWVTAHRGHLYVCGARFDEVEADTGKVMRSAAIAADYLGLPVFFGDRAYIGVGHSGYVVALPEMTGEAVHLYDPGDIRPIYWHGRVFVQGPLPEAQALSVEGPRVARAFRVYGRRMEGHGLAPVGNGLLFEVDRQTGGLAAYSTDSGEQRWRSTMEIGGACSTTHDQVFVMRAHRLPGRRGGRGPGAQSWALHVLDAVDRQVALGVPSAGGGLPGGWASAGDRGRARDRADGAGAVLLLESMTRTSGADRSCYGPVGRPDIAPPTGVPDLRAGGKQPRDRRQWTPHTDPRPRGQPESRVPESGVTGSGPGPPAAGARLLSRKQAPRVGSASPGRQAMGARSAVTFMLFLVTVAATVGLAGAAANWADHPENRWVQQSPRAARRHPGSVGRGAAPTIPTPSSGYTTAGTTVCRRAPSSSHGT